jgi:hypothetical protein
MSKYNEVFLDSQPFKMEWISNVLEIPLSPSFGVNGISNALEIPLSPSFGVNVIITMVPFATSVIDDGGGEFPKHG